MEGQPRFAWASRWSKLYSGIAFRFRACRIRIRPTWPTVSDSFTDSATVLASYVRAPADAHMDRPVYERDTTDARRATRLTLERRPSQKATVLGGSNSSIEAENSSS